MTAPDPKKAKHRSPAYPAINLKKALAFAQTFYDAEKRHGAPVAVAAKHFGYSEKSSGGALAVGALMHFGLMSDEGTGPTRRVKLTDLALRILLDERPDSPEKAAAIKQAALLPKIHSELYKKYSLPLPSDATIRTYLLLERHPAFNESVVNDFIKEYKDTVAFAKIAPSDTIGHTVADPDDIGDDGEEAPPMDDLTVRKRPEVPPPPRAKVEEAEEGEVERLRFNLKGGRRVRLFFSGHLPTQADIEKLIANLELNKDTFPEGPEE